MLERIEETFSRVRKENRAAFVAYLCAGDPDYTTSLAAAKAILESGVDVLELGAPFSDPLADGVTNQLAAQRALANGFRTADLFRLVEDIRKKDNTTPIIIYTYYNLLCAPGVESYVRRAMEAGVDGLLVLDLPPEEAEPLLEISREVGMGNIFIVAPTTPDARIPIIAEVASGFIYYVSRAGVTGERKDLAGDLAESVERIRRCTDLSVVVGFGISSAEQVRAVAMVADGVVVGSTLVNCIPAEPSGKDAICERLRQRMADLTANDALVRA